MTEERRKRLYAALKTLRGRRAAEIDEQVAEFIRSAEADRKHAKAKSKAPTSKPKGRQKKQKQYNLVWQFEDGRKFPQSVEDYESQLLRQYTAMANSDDPVLRVQGQRLMAEVAKRLAAGRVSKANLKPKSETITRADIEKAQALHETREAQARHLGITVRHLQRLLKREK